MSYDLDENTIIVVTVDSGNNAYEAGVREGDLLYSYMGQRIGTSQQLTEAIAQHRNSETVTLQIIRSGEMMELSAQSGPLRLSTRQVNPDEIDAFQAKLEAKNVIVTTAPTLEGYRVVETIDLISAECVYGMNIFRDIFAEVRDVFGGRSKASQKVLRDAKRTCLAELRTEAHLVGANAVIATDLDYQEISGGGKHGMLMLVANGTAVRVERNDD